MRALPSKLSTLISNKLIKKLSTISKHKIRLSQLFITQGF